MASTDKQDFERGHPEKNTPVKDFMASIIGACFVLGAAFFIILGFAWAIGADVRTSRTKAAENFMIATRNADTLLEQGEIMIGRGEKKTIVAMVSGRRYRDTRPTKVTCVFGRDGDVDAYAEVLVNGRWSTNLSNYKVTGKIDEAIARCAYFEQAAQRGMKNAVKDGFWKEIPEFTYH
jgi:hypothetical protein